MIIREALPGDDARIGELLVDAFLSTYARKMPGVVYDEARKNELRDVAGKRSRALVLAAESGGMVVGTVALFRPGAATSEAWLPGFADLRHLAVDPRFHGKGVAKPLMDRAEAIAREEWRADGVCLHVRRGVDGVARLYESRGYRRDPTGDLVKPSVTLDAYALRFDRMKAHE